MSEMPDDAMKIAEEAVRPCLEYGVFDKSFHGLRHAVAKAIVEGRKGWIEVPPGKGVMFVDLDQSGVFPTPTKQDGTP